MGSCNNKQQSKTDSATNRVNPVDIFLHVCSSWGMDNHVSNVEKNLITFLKSKGYDVKFEVVPQHDGLGEVTVYASRNAKKQVVFTNKKEKIPAGEEVGFPKGITVDSKHNSKILSFIESM